MRNIVLSAVLALALLTAQARAVHLVPSKHFVAPHEAGKLGGRDYQIGGPSADNGSNGWGVCFAACQPWEDFTQSCSTTVDQVHPCFYSQKAIDLQANCFACASLDINDAQDSMNSAVESCVADGFQVETPTISQLSTPISSGATVSATSLPTSALVTSMTVSSVGSSQPSTFGLPSATPGLQSASSSSPNTASQPGTSAQPDIAAPSTTTNGAVSTIGRSYALFAGVSGGVLVFLWA